MRTFVGSSCVRLRSFSSEVFADKTSKAFLLPFLALREQDLFRNVLVLILVAALLETRDLEVHIWVVVTSYQGQPAGGGDATKEEMKFSPTKYPETR